MRPDRHIFAGRSLAGRDARGAQIGPFWAAPQPGRSGPGRVPLPDPLCAVAVLVGEGSAMMKSYATECDTSARDRPVGARQWAGDRLAPDRCDIADTFRDLAGRKDHRPDRRQRSGDGRACPVGGVEAPARTGVGDHMGDPGGHLLRDRVAILARLGIPATSLVAPPAVAAVALGFGAQRIVQDLLAGFFIITERQYGFGDLIRLSVPSLPDPAIGTVEDVTLRVTTVRTAGGEVVITPNGQISQATNLSRDWARAVVDVPVPAAAAVNPATDVLRLTPAVA